MSDDPIYEDEYFDVFQDDKGGIVLYPAGADDGVAWDNKTQCVESITQLLIGIREAE